MGLTKVKFLPDSSLNITLPKDNYCKRGHDPIELVKQNNPEIYVPSSSDVHESLDERHLKGCVAQWSGLWTLVQCFQVELDVKS